MAGTNLTVLSSPQFPQHFEDAIEFEIRRVQRVLQHTREQIHLRRCDWQDGFCDCQEQGTVHDLITDQEFCGRHFRLVEYRRGL